jgi:hypothetical protein
MNSQRQHPDEQQPEPPDHQRVVIEQYRGPLLEQMREQEADVKLAPLTDEPPIAYHEQAAAEPRQSWLIWLMVRLLNLRDRVSGGWRRLTQPFQTTDTVLNWARVGILLQFISILLWFVPELIWGRFVFSPTEWFRLASIGFYFAGLFNSGRGLISYHRSQQPRMVLILSLIGHILLVFFILTSAGHFG